MSPGALSRIEMEYQEKDNDQEACSFHEYSLGEENINVSEHMNLILLEFSVPYVAGNTLEIHSSGFHEKWKDILNLSKNGRASKTMPNYGYFNRF